jgi:amino acid transporter
MNEKSKLKKELTLFTLVSLGVGSMIGSGIFAMPSAMAAVAGPALIAAIIIAGIMTLFLGISYAELGSAYPLEGGPYSLPRIALGNFGGFFMGWGYFLNMFIGTAAILEVFVVYLGFYVPNLAVNEVLTPLGTSVAIILLWLLTYLNILGVKWGGMYAAITTISRIVALLLFIVVGLFFFSGKNFMNFMPKGYTGIAMAVTLFFWSYTGFETVVIPSEEVKNPKKTIPWAMILTIFITLTIYAFVAFTFLGMIDWKGLNLTVGDWTGIGNLSSPLSNVSFAKGLPWLAAICTIGAMVATAGAGGGWVLFQGRVPYAMAKDKLFWQPLSKVHKKYHTPVYSLIFASVLTTIIMIMIPNFPSVALVASITAAVTYGSAVIAVPILRKTDPKTHRPFRLPLMRLTTLLGFIFATYLIYWARWPWTLVGGVTMLTGYIAYFFVKKIKWEFFRNIWIMVYLFSIMIVSLIGDKEFSYNNFLPIEPLGYLMFPIDLVVLTILAIVMYYWIYKANINYKPLKDLIEE